MPPLVPRVAFRVAFRSAVRPYLPAFRLPFPVLPFFLVPFSRFPGLQWSRPSRRPSSISAAMLDWQSAPDSGNLKSFAVLR